LHLDATDIDATQMPESAGIRKLAVAWTHGVSVLKDGERVGHPQSIVARRKRPALLLFRAAANGRFPATKLPVMPVPKPCSAAGQADDSLLRRNMPKAALYNPRRPSSVLVLERLCAPAARISDWPATQGSAAVPVGHPRAHAPFLPDACDRRMSA
jgi:hypothetical protein